MLVRPYVCPYVRPQNPSYFGHIGPISGVLDLIWAYFGGSGPDLGQFGPISAVLDLIWVILGLFSEFWT